MITASVMKELRKRMRHSNYRSTFKVRSSHQRCSIRKAVLWNFAKSTGKHLCQSLFFNKVAGLFYRTPPEYCVCNVKIAKHEMYRVLLTLDGLSENIKHTILTYLFYLFYLQLYLMLVRQ